MMKAMTNLKQAMGLEKKAMANLKKVRLEKGFSQQKLADAVGLNVASISLIELGKRHPTLLTCYRLALALDVELSDLL